MNRWVTHFQIRLKELYHICRKMLLEKKWGLESIVTRLEFFQTYGGQGSEGPTRQIVRRTQLFTMVWYCPLWVLTLIDLLWAFPKDLIIMERIFFALRLSSSNPHKSIIKRSNTRNQAVGSQIGSFWIQNQCKNERWIEGQWLGIPNLSICDL